MFGTTVTLLLPLPDVEVRALGAEESETVSYPIGATLYVDGTGVNLTDDADSVSGVDVFVYDEDNRCGAIDGAHFIALVSDADALAALGVYHYRRLTGGGR
jgi:hypothetical protein